MCVCERDRGGGGVKRNDNIKRYVQCCRMDPANEEAPVK